VYAPGTLPSCDKYLVNVCTQDINSQVSWVLLWIFKRDIKKEMLQCGVDTTFVSHLGDMYLDPIAEEYFK